MPHVKSGKLKVLAIAADRRISAAPDVPTLIELGYPEASLGAWNGIWVAAGTPQPIVDRLSSEIARILRNPEVRRKLEDAGVQAVGSTSAEFAEFLDKEMVRWQLAAKVTGIKVE